MAESCFNRHSLHIKRIVFGFAILTNIPLASFAQPRNILNYKVPQGYTILDKVSGDLNKDGFRDYLIILKDDNEKEYGGDSLRTLVILMGSKNNKLIEYTHNDSVVLCRYCGGLAGDPYKKVSIKNNQFTVNHAGGSGWRWNNSVTFQFDSSKKAFILVNDIAKSWHVSEPKKIETFLVNKENYGKLLFEKYSSYNE